MFLRIFFSKKDSLGTRIKLCAAVVSFSRLKRHWIANDRSYTLGRNSESRQAFQHHLLQVESAALKIQRRCERNQRAHARGEPLIPVCLSKSGSDSCESAFSKLGGYGAVQLNRRNFNADDAIEMAGDLLQLAQYEYDPEHPLVFTRANKNLGIDMTGIEEDPNAPDANMTEILTHADIVREAEAGLALAHSLARRVGMHIDYPKLPPWWHAPWLNDSAVDGRMREADLEDNINDHATADDASYSMREHDDGDDVGALAARADALAVELRKADAADVAIADASIADVATAAAATQAPASTVVALRARAADAAAAAADAATAAAAASDALADENPVGCGAPGADQGMDVDGQTGHEECASARPNEGAAARVVAGRRRRPAKAPHREQREPTRRSNRLAPATMRNDGNAVDAMEARLQLRQLMDEAEAEAERQAQARAAEAQARSPDGACSAVPIATHVLTPRGEMHKQTMNTHLITAHSRGVPFSADRCFRAAQAAKAAGLPAPDNSSVARQGMLGRGADVCCLFAADRASGPFLQCGRVSTLYDSKGNERTDQVAFDDRAGMRIVGRWYDSDAADGHGLSFTYNVDDSSRYDAT